MSDRPIAISVQGVHKSFWLPETATHGSFFARIHPVQRGRGRELKVLDDVSFDVVRGEMFGIVGKNGSGKTTLMRILASIFAADRGRVLIEGQIAPFLDLGIGFNGEMSAGQNVVQNGVILGLSRAELRRRTDEILEFAGVEGFREVPLKHFSTGMRVRLAFAVMLQADADVLLVDEILAVGDAEFRERSMDTFIKMLKSGKTIVFVSHSMSVIERHCDNAMLLNRGKAETSGDTREAVRRYMEVSLESDSEGKGKRTRGLVAERRDRAAIADLRLVDANEARATQIPEAEAIELRARIEIRKRLRSPGLRLELRAEKGAKVFGPPDVVVEDTVFERGERVEARAVIANPLTPGTYRLSCMVVGQSPRGPIAASEAAAIEFDIAGRKRGSAGLVKLDHEVSFERERSAELTTT